MGRGFGQGFEGRAGGQFPGGYGPGFDRPHFFFGGQIIGLLMMLVVVALVVLVFWKLYQKAGFNGALGLLMLVPGVNVVAMLFLAFAEWPALKELERLRAWRLALASGTVPVPAAAAAAEPAAPVATPPAAPSA